jgi:hypothetical protein
VAYLSFVPSLLDKGDSTTVLDRFIRERDADSGRSADVLVSEWWDVVA